MISDGAFKAVELHFAGPVPDEGDYPTELEATCGTYCTWIDPKLLGETRTGVHTARGLTRNCWAKIGKEYMRKHGVFEVF